MGQKPIPWHPPAANFVGRLLDDVRAVFGEGTEKQMKDLNERFHFTIRYQRRLTERRSKKQKRMILSGSEQ